MRCEARPYEGSEPYIFVSYAHSSASLVYPMIEQLVSDGYRVWYDEGLHPGDDWLDVIAEHLDRSAVCLAAVTPAFCASHNCRSEVTLALDLGKAVISVIMEDLELPLGSRLLLGPSHMLRRLDYGGKEGFFRKLYATPVLAPCRGPRVSFPEQPPEDLTLLLKKPEGMTVRITSNSTTAVLADPVSCRIYSVPGLLTTVSPEEDSDLCLSQCSLRMRIVRWHRAYYLQDMGTPGGLQLDGKRLEPEERRRLGVCARIGGEKQLLFFAGSEARTLRRRRRLHLLFLEGSDIWVPLCYWQDLFLGRGMDLGGTVLTDSAVSHTHARIRLLGEEATVMDLGSANGTLLDGAAISVGVDVPLADGALLRLGDTTFRYKICTLE